MGGREEVTDGRPEGLTAGPPCRIPSLLVRVPTDPMPSTSPFSLSPIGVVRSPLTSLDEAPLQGDEGAPDAWIEVEAEAAPGLEGIAPGDEIVVLTWLHRAQRDVLRVYPRREVDAPLRGVFTTRSPDRPNPIGLHRVTVRAVEATRLRVGPLEALDGTPVVDLKPVL